MSDITTRPIDRAERNHTQGLRLIYRQMNLNGKKIILGSGSPRRKELLAGLDIDFIVDTDNNFVETNSLDCAHSRIPEIMSQGKSHGFHRPLAEDEILITSDTLVLRHAEGDENDWDNGTVLGKPHSREEAVEMIRSLSDTRHRVITAVTIRDSRHEITLTDSCDVHFDQISDADIDYYIDKYRPFDKAGAYGVQEWIGYAHLKGISGSFYTVMGFPVRLVYKELQKFLQL